MKIIAAVLLAMLAMTACAQQAPPPYTLQLSARAVVLDVVVTDKKGHIVKGLGKDAFTVYEDGASQTVRTLDPSAVELPPPALAISSTAELDRKAPNAPVNIIVLDEINTRFEDEAFARYSLKHFLDSQGASMPPTMLVAVDIQHFKVLQDFTTSKDAILGSLKGMQITNPWRSGNPAWQGQQLTAAVNSLMRVSQATSGHKGHKTMIWIGRGFPRIDPDQSDSDLADGLRKAMEECANEMRDARVVLYTLDPAGVSVEPVPLNSMGFSEDPFGGSIDFERMALASGGKAFSGRNDVDRLIATSAEEGTQFYTLSYVPSAAAQDDAKPFRSVKVVMKDPNLVASTRLGYYSRASAGTEAAESADGTISHQLLHDLALAGDGTLVYDAVPFAIDRDLKEPDSFLLKVPSAELKWKADDAGDLVTEVSVLVKVFDRKGNVLEQDARLQKLKFPASPGQSTPKATTTALPVMVKTAVPAARIRFALRVDSTGKIGTNNYFLADPKTLEDPSIGLKPKR